MESVLAVKRRRLGDVAGVLSEGVGDCMYNKQTFLTAHASGA